MSGSTLVLTTDAGVIAIDVHDTAPRTARFVRALVARGDFDGSAFYRSTTLEDSGRAPLIQGGPLAPLFTGSTQTPPRIDLLETVESTTSTGLSHRRGTVSLARDLLDTGHVLPELFICLDDDPELDACGRTEPDELGFPAFGTVRSGLDVAADIARRELSGSNPLGFLAGQILTDPVTITHASWGVISTEGTT